MTGKNLAELVSELDVLLSKTSVKEKEAGPTPYDGASQTGNELPNKESEQHKDKKTGESLKKGSMDVDLLNMSVKSSRTVNITLRENKREPTFICSCCFMPGGELLLFDNRKDHKMNFLLLDRNRFPEYRVSNFLEPHVAVCSG